MFAKRELEVQVILKNLNQEGFEDVSKLLEKRDGFTETLVIGLVKKMFCNYSLVNDSVALIIASLIKDCYKKYGADSVGKVSECFVTKIGERTYAVGVNTFISRMKSLTEGV